MSRKLVWVLITLILFSSHGLYFNHDVDATACSLLDDYLSGDNILVFLGTYVSSEKMIFEEEFPADYYKHKFFIDEIFNGQFEEKTIIINGDQRPQLLQDDQYVVATTEFQNGYSSLDCGTIWNASDNYHTDMTVSEFVQKKTPTESFAQTDNLDDYLANWHLGKNLKQGDYFSYRLCHVDYKDCSELIMNMWIKGDKQVGSETKWLVKVVVYDDNEIIKGEMELGKISPEPTGGSEDLGVYRGVFKSSVAWLSSFTTSYGNSDVGWIATSWNDSPGNIDNQIFPLEIETITVPAGTWESVAMSWKTGGVVSKVWIVDDLPFPIRANVFNNVITEPIALTEYEFSLLEYGENVQQNPFDEVVTTEDMLIAKGCDMDFEREASTKKPTNNFDYQIHAFYGPEDPVKGCEMQWLVKFLSKHDDTEFLNQVQYDILVLDDNGKTLRSIAQEEGRNFLYSPSGQGLVDFIVKEDPDNANYVIWIYGLAPEGVVPSTAADYLEISVPIFANDQSFPILTPVLSLKQQIKNGIVPEYIQCNKDHVLVTRTNDKLACVFESTVHHKNWVIIDHLISNPNIENQNEKPDSIQIINTGWWAGECVGICSAGMTITSDTIMLHDDGIHSSYNCHETHKELPLSKEEWRSLINLVDLEKFNALPDKIGEPGETDGAIVHIEISDGQKSKSVRFEQPDEIPDIEEFAMALEIILDNLESKHYSGCIAKES